jgi:hypothetical protein
MCLEIDESVTSLNKRVVWKVFDKPEGGEILSLFQSFKYPKGKLIERSRRELGPTRRFSGALFGNEGLHFYLTKAIAREEASCWGDSYIAKFAVDPSDFMYKSVDGREAMYERATRVGNYIKVGLKTMTIQVSGLAG